MRSITQLLAVVFSRQTIGFVLFVCLAVLIWFIGPALSLGGLRPLSADPVRIVCVVLLVMLAVLWLVSGPLSLFTVSALALLTWQAGPLLAVGDARPLAAVWSRAVLIGLLAVGYLLYWLYRLLAAMRADENFLANVLAFGQRRSIEDPAREDVKRIEGSMRHAIAQLRSLRLRGSAWRRILEIRAYLYELPWYLVLGAPGAGKTTALRSGGLQFFGATFGGAQTPRIGGMGFVPEGPTLQCDWILSNRAVLIDTAGRYVTHAGNPAKDPFEWLGLLGLLRRYRARAPVNGVIVTLGMAELLQMTPSERADHAASLRARLLEMRQQLGIRVPVYLIVTKMDVICGFAPYFQSLTSDGRVQPWGFTLPYREVDAGPSDKTLQQEVADALGLLHGRLAEGLHARMSEEFDAERRRSLFALPGEFSAAMVALRDVIDPMFLDSRFDPTQSSSMLRGVYFTSGAQSGVEVPSSPNTLFRRLHQTLHGPTDHVPDTRPAHVGQGFFLQDVLAKVIFPEAHLVRPNLRWEFRFRAMRLLGHAMTLGLVLWLASALVSSFANNRDYLRAVEQRAVALADRVRTAASEVPAASTSVSAPAPASDVGADVFDLLEAARALPIQPGLYPDRPPLGFTYGLYSAAPAMEAASRVYADLQERLLLPAVLQRMAAVLAASIKDNDSRAAYDTLRVYRLLHDRKHYIEADGAASVREWVRKDTQVLADPTMAVHFDALFSRGRVVQATSLADDSLIRSVQDFLDGDTATQRIYERAKAAMQVDAPTDFTLVRAVGPQVGAVFVRSNGLPLDKGVPGLFTYDGYHRLFAPRVSDFVRVALEDDAWVMGRGVASGARETTRSSDEWIAHVRQQYLTEYVAHWDAFLGSVRAVVMLDAVAPDEKTRDVASGSVGLGFNLSVLRQLAAPDSPLSRLARAAVRETTLARAPTDSADEGSRSLLNKAASVLRSPSLPVETETAADSRRLEREIVDKHFGALREVVTGSADAVDAHVDGAATPAIRAAGMTGGKLGLDAISGLLNDFYTWMVLADTALAAGGVPPGSAEAGARLRLEAGKLPPPFKEILAGLEASSGVKVAQGATEILRRQAQLQLDRLMALMAVQVSEPCKRGIEGRYPFVAVAQDAAIDDFTLVFAAGGALDEFFSKYLASLVDTSVRPWRYRNPDSANAPMAVEAPVAGMPVWAAPSPAAGPTLLGELLKLLARDGPSLDAFFRAQQIRSVFFRDAGSRKMAWKMDLTVRELEPSITELLLDIDGQGQRYVHGPVQPLSIVWPGPRGGLMAEITAQPRVSGATSTLLAQGPWALFRLLDKGRVVDTATPGRMSVEFLFDGRKTLIELGTGTQPHPLNSDLLKGFRCPGRTA